jgi:hypothetical protein
VSESSAGAVLGGKRAFEKPILLVASYDILTLVAKRA